MLLSFRAALERFPRQIRFLVAFLALLSFVAPTWHICEMGGMTAMTVPAHGAMAHHLSFQKSVGGAAICFCAVPNNNEYHSVRDQLSGRMAHNHTSCLALILSGMFALSPSTLRLPVVQTERLISPNVRISWQSRELIRHFRGRAPPFLNF